MTHVSSYRHPIAGSTLRATELMAALVALGFLLSSGGPRLDGPQRRQARPQHRASHAGGVHGPRSVASRGTGRGGELETTAVLSGLEARLVNPAARTAGSSHSQPFVSSAPEPLLRAQDTRLAVLASAFRADSSYQATQPPSRAPPL